jgi:hypothetical protein
MNKLVAVLACAVALTGFLQAAAPSDASVQELLALTGEDQKTKESGFAQVESMMAAFTKQAPSPKAIPKDALRKALPDGKEILDSMKAAFPWKRIEEMTTQFYKETFTQEEVDGLIAFYKSPLGQVTLKKNPLVNQRVMAGMPQLMAPMMKKINEKGAAEIKEIEAEAAQKKEQREQASREAEQSEREAERDRAAAAGLAERLERLKALKADFDKAETERRFKLPVQKP